MTDIDQIIGLPDGRVCTQCSEWKTLESYSKSKDCKFGRRAQCKECDAAYRRELRSRDPGHAREMDKAARERNKKSRRAYAVKKYWENREKIIAQIAIWTKENPEKVKSNRQRRYIEKHESILEYTREYRKKNPEIVRAIAKRKGKKLRATPRGILEIAMRRRVGQCISGESKRGRRLFDLLGYTADDLRAHLEGLFQPGMTWENYGKYGWHIDHKIPLAAHNYETPDDLDFKRAWALSNLQPLWWRDNISKGAKIKGGFQPSLTLAIPRQQDEMA